MNSKLEKLRNKFDKLGVDAILVKESNNYKYLSGFGGTSATLFISKNKQVLITDFRYIERSTKEAPDFEIVNQGSSIYDVINSLIKEENITNLGFEDTHTTYSDYGVISEKLNAKLVPIKDTIEVIRRVKYEEELECLRKAESIGDQAFTHILGFIKEGVTELEIALELEFFMRRAGANGLSFDSIVASGINSSMPHAVPSDKKVEKGDFVTMDFGCIYKGYCSDMTRTIVVGKATDKQKEIYNTVLNAQLSALRTIKSGLEGKFVDSIAREIISDAGYGDCFGHGLGHCVGLEIHENPRFSPADSTVFEENMVVTVEPGIYIPGFGGVRIEDMVIVKNDGYVNLTSSPKELIEL
jgi:Xaa-Pro aminopeptidase